MPDHSSYASRLREIADALDAMRPPSDDGLTPHPDTLDVINNRHTKRGQFNYAVPEVLQLQRRVRQYHADTGVPHGDVVTMAVDTWLRVMGYPPNGTLARKTPT
ncbi:hypothetical protein ACGFY7_46215 [Streptomyces prunicolor]|uniref:hypothetical protein n=1 Tax=Streptomyces prunicolor TaxID=67348 RepID=UPI00371E2903